MLRETWTNLSETGPNGEEFKKLHRSFETQFTSAASVWSP